MEQQRAGTAADCRERLQPATCRNLWSSRELVLLLPVKKLHPATYRNLWSSEELVLLLTVERLHPATCRAGTAADCREVATCNL